MYLGLVLALIVFTNDVHGRPNLSSKDVKELRGQLSDYGIDYNDDVWNVLKDSLDKPESRDGQEDGKDYGVGPIPVDYSKGSEVEPLLELSEVKDMGQVTDIEEIEHLIPLNGEKTKEFLKKEGLDGEDTPNNRMPSRNSYSPDGLSRILKLFDIDSLDQIKSVQPIESIQHIDDMFEIEDMAHIEEILPIDTIKKIDPNKPLDEQDLEVKDTADTEEMDGNRLDMESDEIYRPRELEALSASEMDVSREIPVSRQIDSDPLEADSLNFDDIRQRGDDGAPSRKQDLVKLVGPLEKLIDKQMDIEDLLDDKYKKAEARLKAIDKVRQKHKDKKNDYIRKLEGIKKKIGDVADIEEGELESVSPILEMEKIDDVIPLLSMKEVKRIIPLTDFQAEKLRKMASLHKFRPEETETAAAAEAEKMISRRHNSGM